MQIQANYLVNGLTPSSVGGTGTAVKYFPNLPGSAIGTANTTPSATSSVGQLPFPGSSRLNGQKAHINVVGYVDTDNTIVCPTVEIALYANISTTSTPSYTKIATTTATTAGNFNNEPYSLDVDIYGDSNSGIVYGWQRCMYNGAIANTAAKALTANLSGINMAAEPPFGLVVGVTFGTTGAKNIAYLTQFSIES